MVSTTMYPPENLLYIEHHRTSHGPPDPKDNHRLDQFTWEGSLKIRIPGRVSKMAWCFMGLCRPMPLMVSSCSTLDGWSTEIHWTDFIPFSLSLYIYIYAAVSRVATPPPTPHGMGPKPTFWLHFHGTRRNTWYLQCFDKLGLRNRGIDSVL